MKRFDCLLKNVADICKEICRDMDAFERHREMMAELADIESRVRLLAAKSGVYLMPEGQA